MQPKKEDLRVQKTKQNIKTTFLTLLEKYPLDKIHVQEILDAAKINRATFYKYYNDKYDLAQQLADECLDAVALLVEKRFDEEIDTTETHAIIFDVYNYLKTNRKTVLALWKSEGCYIHLYNDMEKLLQNLCLEHLSKDVSLSEEFRDYFATIYATVVMTTIRWHIERDRELDFQSIIHRINQTVHKVLL